MSPVDILFSAFSAALLVITLAPIYLVGRYIFDRRRAARWRRMREPWTHGDDGDVPKPHANLTKLGD